jgi:tRNA nucleotidyltransferase (CCA-adding enzyme)
MKIYLVGGAVRDKLLGIDPKEKDWVVVNGNRDKLIDMGYKQVGKDFPVFLHPETSEEYALARVERKVDKGHKGFKFDTNNNVTLEEDLSRRDITINAIAQDDNGKYIDPYNGILDIKNRTIKHVSNAFVEDPLRTFRVARFYAQFSEYDFTIHESTYKIMRKLSETGEIETLSKERLWGELSKAFNAKKPWMFFEVLIKSNVAKNYFPELLDNSLLEKKINFYSNLDIEKDIFLSIAGFSINFVETFGFPKKILDLYFMFNEFSVKLISLKNESKDILDFLNSLDAFRRPQRLQYLIKQIELFQKFHNMKDENKLHIFKKLKTIIENKIDYGNLSNLSVYKIKERVEHINLSIINLVLSEED